MLALSGAEHHFAGLVLLDCESIHAECVGLFAASSAENRLKYLKGFIGAAFTTSTSGRVALEVVCWENAAALAGARATPVFAEHVSVVEHHVKVRHVAFSSRYAAGHRRPIGLVRGARFSLALYKRPMPRAGDDVGALLRSMADSAPPQSLLHITENGLGLALLAQTAPDPSAWRAAVADFGEPYFQDDFVVVESVAAPAAGDTYHPTYSLTLRSDPCS